MKRVLITGSGGFLGSFLVRNVPKHFDLYGTFYNSPSMIPKENSIALDLSDIESIEQVLNELDPDIIIHAAAISSESVCKHNSHSAYHVNVASVDILADWTLKNQRRLIFISSDLVFDGNHSPYKEEDPLRPSLRYGCLKAQAEQVISGHPNATILRLPLLYGIGYGKRKGTLWDLIERSRRKETIKLFKDEFRTPLYARDACEFIWKICSQEVSGKIHLAGEQRLSRVELGRLFFHSFQLNENLIEEITRRDIGMEDRPKDTSLLIERAKKLGFEPTDIDMALIEIQSEWKTILY